MVPLRTFFTFAAEHEALLRELFELRDGITGAALRRLAAGLRSETGPSPDTVIQRLFDYGIIEERASESLMLELTRPVRDFMGHLLSSHELVTPEVIRGYLTELDNESRALAQAAAGKDEQLALLSLEKLVSAIERVRHYAQINQMAILERVLAIKNRPERYTVRERFLRINDLWDHYLVPLRTLIEPGGGAHATFDRTGREVSTASVEFRYQGALYRALRETEVRLQRMRTDVTTAFTEAYREVLPLYEKLRRQDGIARGTASLLETLAKSGPRRLAARAPLALVRFRMLGQINDAEMIARLVGVLGYDPAPPPPLAHGDAEGRMQLLPLSEVLDSLNQALPVIDTLGWLIERYPERPLIELLRVYTALLQAPSLTHRYGMSPVVHQHGARQLQCHPLRLETRA